MLTLLILTTTFLKKALLPKYLMYSIFTKCLELGYYPECLIILWELLARSFDLKNYLTLLTIKVFFKKKFSNS